MRCNIDLHLAEDRVDADQDERVDPREHAAESTTTSVQAPKRLRTWLPCGVAKRRR
jgi:hypothetical protein